jgi:hypothetical protein
MDRRWRFATHTPLGFPRHGARFLRTGRALPLRIRLRHPRDPVRDTIGLHLISVARAADRRLGLYQPVTLTAWTPAPAGTRVGVPWEQMPVKWRRPLSEWQRLGHRTTPGSHGRNACGLKTCSQGHDLHAPIASNLRALRKTLRRSSQVVKAPTPGMYSSMTPVDAGEPAGGRSNLPEPYSALHLDFAGCRLLSHFLMQSRSVELTLWP